MHELQPARAHGVYADWPAAEYHACEAPSFSRLINLISGPAAYWRASPWNPDYANAPSEAQLRGSALHCLALEGESAFRARYAAALDPALYPDALRGADALRAECRAHGLPVSGTMAEMAARLRPVVGPGRIWLDIEAEWRAALADRIELSADAEAQVRVMAAALEAQPDFSAATSDVRAKSEVSVCFELAGVPMRARFDLWRPGEIIDLKRHAQRALEPYAMSAVRTIARNLYHVQAAIYRHAAMAALAMPDSCWHGFSAEEIAAFREAGAPDYRIVFCGAPVPSICQRIMAPQVPLGARDGPREPSALWQSAEVIVSYLIGAFAGNFARFGRAPWIEDSPARGLLDRDPGLSQWALSRDTELESE